MNKIASAKKVVKNQNKLTDLQIQIMELQEKEKALQKEISLNLSTILYTTNALTVPHDILVGGILHIVNSYNDNTREAGEWQQAGATFLEKKKSSKSTKNLNINLRKLRQTQIMINRKTSQVSVINYKTAKAESSNRKARTRTLVQLGSLVSLSGLASLLNIQGGDDLQFDMEAKDKAAMLLGALAEITDTASPSLSQQEKWKEKGIRLLKMRAYQNRS